MSATAVPPTTRVRSTILVVDDHPLMRSGLARLINDTSDLAVCGEAGSADEALRKVPRCQPDLVILDIAMPGRSGIELVKDLRARDSQVLLLVVSMHDEPFLAERALRAGAQGYVLKEAGAANVLKAIRQVLAGGIYVSPRIAEKLLATFSSAHPWPAPTSVANLTDREFEVFRHLAAGKCTLTIAGELRISEKTVDVHRANIRRKLGLPDNTALVAYAARWIK